LAPPRGKKRTERSATVWAAALTAGTGLPVVGAEVPGTSTAASRETRAKSVAKPSHVVRCERLRRKPKLTPVAHRVTPEEIL